MTTYAVTGASGRLGSEVVTSLLKRGVAPGDIVAVVRDVRSVDHLADQGVDVRVGEYDDRDTMRRTFDSVDRLLFVSGEVTDKRQAQHLNVIGAAADAGVTTVAYTSMLYADRTEALLAADHLVTEKALFDSGIPTTVALRNGWYWENYLPLAHIAAFETGLIPGIPGPGKDAGAARSDLADAASAVLLLDDPRSVYELAAGPGLDMDEIVAAIVEVTGAEVSLVPLTEERYAAFLESVGIPELYAGVVADTLTVTASSTLQGNAEDLESLIGRPALSFADVLRASLPDAPVRLAAMSASTPTPTAEAG